MLCASWIRAQKGWLMAKKQFTLQIVLDGSDVGGEARAMREAIEKQIGAITVEGYVNVAGLGEAAGLMAQLRADAGSFGRAIAQGLSSQMASAKSKMADLQSEISGIVRVSDDLANIEVPMSEEVENLLKASDAKGMKAVGKIEALTASLRKLNEERADLLAVKVTPLAGGIGVRLEKLAKGLEGGYKGYITRVRKKIDKEVEALTTEIGGKQVRILDEIDRIDAEARKRATKVLPGLEKAAADAAARFEAVLAEKPMATSLVPSTSQSIAEWDSLADRLVRRHQQLEAQLVDATGETREKLAAEQAKVYAEILELQAYEPTEEMREWVTASEQARDESLAAQQAFREKKRQLDRGEADELRATLDMKRRALEADKAEELMFIREYQLERAELIRQLEKDGQKEAANALVRLQIVNEAIREETSKRNKQISEIQKGQKATLPKGAEGTLVDFVVAEKNLAQEADAATKALEEQRKELVKYMKAVDEASHAALGLNEAQRYGAKNLEAAAKREIRKKTRASVPLEQAAANEREILSRLNTQILSLRDDMRASFDEPVTEGQEEQARGLLGLWRKVRDILVGNSIIPDMVEDINAWLAQIDPDQAKFDQLVADADTTAEQVVASMGQIARAVPVEQLGDRLEVLRVELDLLGQEFSSLTLQGSEASQRQRALFEQAVNNARRMRGYSPEDEAMFAEGYLPKGFGVSGAETQWDRGLGRTAEGDDAWYRAMKVDLDAKVQYTKAQQKEVESILGQMAAKEAEYASLVEGLWERAEQLSEAVGSQAEPFAELAELEKVSDIIEELTVDYAGLSEAQQETVEKTATLVELTKKEAALAFKRTDKGRRDSEALRRAKASARTLGLEWSQVEQAMDASGAELRVVVRELERAEAKQDQISRDALEIRDHYRGAGGAVRLFVKELNEARRENQGLFEMSRDLQEIGNSLKMNAAIVTGAVTVAGRDYVEFAKQSDIAARSLALNRDLTLQLRDATVDQAAALAVLSPQETAAGITEWAQATGQMVGTQGELNALLSQTVPIQQAATLTQTDIRTLTDATAGALNQYKLELSDTERVVAIFNKVSDDTLAAVGDVAEGFKYVGPTANRAGESIEDTAAAFSILGDNGIRGTQAGTSYGRMLENLLVPNSEQARDLFVEMFGTESPFFDAEGTFIGTARALEVLTARTQDMTDAERESALSVIFDTNALRAATVLMREMAEAREEGQNALIESSADLSRSALDEWRSGVADWEATDVYRVEQAKLRWQAFWLEVGQQGLDAALPYLEKASELVGDLTATLDANPWLADVVMSVATGALAIGTVVTAVGTVSKIALTLKSTFEAAKATLLKRQTADQKFQTTVVSSAETFRKIIVEAAGQAAGVEVKGAETETAIEQRGASTAAKILGRLATAAIVGELGSQALTGQSLVGWAGTREGVRAGEEQLAGLGGASVDELRAMLGDLRDDIELLDRYVVQEGEQQAGTLLNPRYWSEVVFGGVGGAGDYERLTEMMGGRSRAMSGKALEDKFAELKTLEAGVISQINAQIYARADEVDALQEADTALDAHVQALIDYSGVTGSILDQYDTEKIENAVEIYEQMLEEQADALKEFNDSLAELNADLADDLARLAEKYAQDRVKEEADFQEDILKDQREFLKRQADALREHQKAMARMEEDHYMTLWDLSLSRDAAGMYKENQRYAVERRRAEEDFRDSQGQEQQNFQQEQAERQREHAIKMADLAARYAEERAQRLADHAEAVAELQAEHAERMERLKLEYFERLNAELEYYTLSQQQLRLYQAAMLGDAVSFLQNNRAIWQQYVASLPVPGIGAAGASSQSAWDQYMQASQGNGYAAGGYVGQTGMARVHSGEFVLNRGTVSALERTWGSLSQETFRGGAGGIRIDIGGISGMGMGPREVARMVGAEVEQQLYATLTAAQA